MKLDRRSFFKVAGGAALAATAAVYIPAERLEFGVPKPVWTPETFWGAETIWGLPVVLAEPGGPGLVRVGSTLSWENKFLDAEEIVLPGTIFPYDIDPLPGTPPYPFITNALGDIQHPLIPAFVRREIIKDTLRKSKILQRYGVVGNYTYDEADWS